MPTFRMNYTAPGLICGGILAAAGVALPGCGPLAESFAMPGATGVPSELVPLQGRWTFDESRTRREEGMADDDEISAEERAFLDVMKQVGVAMSDIEIRGTQITQLGGLLQAQYELLEYHYADGRIIGTALWHEDRHDRGDAIQIPVTLKRNGDTLVFTREDDGESETFYFTRR